MSLTVYFDTNIVRDLSEKRMPQVDQHIRTIKNLITQRKLAIAPSFEVLYEILSAPDTCNSVQIKNAQFYDSLVDWTNALKGSEKMLLDDIDSCIKNGCPASPFYPIDGNQSGFLLAIRNGVTILPIDDWNKVIRKSQSQNKRFVEKLFTDFVSQLPKKGKTELKSNPEKTWQNWWRLGGIAEILANCLAGPVVATHPYPRQNCTLLTIPTICAAVGYILHTWYAQIVDGLQATPTMHYDFRNAVLGAGIGRIITHDKKFRRAVKHIPRLQMNVWTLNELVDHIRTQDITIISNRC